MRMEMNLGGIIILSLVSIIILTVFLGMAFWSFKRKTPMHFWAGTTVDPSEIGDIPAYNKANGIMWLMYGFGITLSMLLIIINPILGSILAVMICVLGTFALVLVYKRIYRKYRVRAKDVAHKQVIKED